MLMIEESLKRKPFGYQTSSKKVTPHVTEVFGTLFILKYPLIFWFTARLM